LFQWKEENDKVKGLILAGGLGTRLRPLTHTGVKQLIPIANKPVVFYGIEALVEAGITEIGIIVGYTEEKINAMKEAVGDGSRWQANITYIEQDAPRGLAHAVYCAKDYMGSEAFVVHLGDNILRGGISKYVSDFVQSDCDTAILLSEVEDPWNYGVAALDERGEVLGLEEKPEKPKSNYAIIGVYLFRPAIFGAIERIGPSRRGELEITTAIQQLVLSKERKVMSYLVDCWWDDTGTAEAVLGANHIILSDLDSSDIQGELEEQVSVTGNVRIGKGTVVRKGCTIRGPAVIGKNCVLESAYIGPYTSIGDNTSIIGGEIESSIVIGNARIETDKRIIDSLIGRHSVITSPNSLPKGCKLIVGDNSDIQI